MGMADLDVLSRAFQDRMFISCSRLVEASRKCAAAKNHILGHFKISENSHPARYMQTRSKFSWRNNGFFFSKFWYSIKIKEKRKVFFFSFPSVSQALLCFRFVSVYRFIQHIHVDVFILHEFLLN